jgi:RNA polymerase sigma factor (sigma-70 family)
MEDSKIVDFYLMRKEEAIKQTSLKYGKQLHSIAMNIVQHSSDAEECENDTYIKAWDSIPPHEPRTYLFAFLARITRHIALDLCKHKNRQKRTALIVELSEELAQCIPAPTAEECQICDEGFGEVINPFLWKLDEDTRNVFIRRYWFLDSIRQIAEEFQMSESKVKSMLFRTRNKLRRYLEKEGILL